MHVNITDRKLVELERERLLGDLGERIKELQAMNWIARILRDDQAPVAEVLEEVAAALPPAFRFPEIAAARAFHHGVDVHTPGYTDSACRLERCFDVNSDEPGVLQLVYVEPPPLSGGENPFLPEEEQLLDSIAEMLSGYFARRAAREALQESESLFRDLLQSVPSVAVQGYLTDGTVRYWNAASETFYGYSREEALGGNLFDLILPPELHEDGKKLLKEVEENGAQIPPGELSLMRKDGSRISVYSSHVTIRRAGRPVEFFSIDIDLTERKQLERQILRAQRTESIGTIAGGVAHNLNNLLTPILLGMELIRDENSDPALLPVLDNITRSAERGSELVKQVLSFARGVDGERVPLQIEELLDEVATIVNQTFPKNIRLDRRVPNDLWPVLGDPTQLNQVLLNLCVNARDAMPDGGKISISVRNAEVDEQYAAQNQSRVPSGRYLALEVEDEGVGMEKEMLDRVFEPFYTTKELGKGTGLGLSTVLGVLRSHGGFVNVYSQPGEGSVFKLYLPASEERAGQKPAESAKATPQSTPSACILLVDDEDAILAVTRRGLEKSGHRVLTATDGAEAISVYAEHRADIDLVITDMMMPVMDGPVLIASLRRITPKLPIIATSGLDSDGYTRQNVRTLTKYFLHKPYSTVQLEDMISTVMQGVECEP